MAEETVTEVKCYRCKELLRLHYERMKMRMSCMKHCECEQQA